MGHKIWSQNIHTLAGFLSCDSQNVCYLHCLDGEFNVNRAWKINYMTFLLKNCSLYSVFCICISVLIFWNLWEATGTRVQTFVSAWRHLRASIVLRDDHSTQSTYEPNAVKNIQWSSKTFAFESNNIWFERVGDASGARVSLDLHCVESAPYTCRTFQGGKKISLTFTRH